MYWKKELINRNKLINLIEKNIVNLSNIKDIINNIKSLDNNIIVYYTYNGKIFDKLAIFKNKNLNINCGFFMDITKYNIKYE